MPILILLLIVGGWTTPAWAEGNWNFQVFSGYSSAALGTLNDKKLNETSALPPKVGGSPSIGGRPLIGVEVEWKVRPRFSLLIQTSFWEGESTAAEQGERLFQDFGIVPFRSTRRTRVSFNEYALRGRYHLIEEPQRHRLYFEVGFFNQVKVTYREDYNYIFEAGGQQFLRNILSEATGRGGYLFVWGIGGDYYLTRRIALGLSANYRIGKAVPILYQSYRHTFLEQDAVSGAVGGGSPFPQPGDPVTFRDGNQIKRLEVDLNGWQVIGGVRIFF